MHTYIHIDKNLFSHVFLRLVFFDHTFGVKHHFFDLSLKLFNPFILFAIIASIRALPHKKKKTFHPQHFLYYAQFYRVD